MGFSFIWWLPLRLSKRQSTPTTVLLRTTLQTRTITQATILTHLGSNLSLLFMYVSFYRKTFFFRHKSFFQITYKFYFKPKKPAQKETKLIITRSGDRKMLGERRNWFIKGNREQNPILQEHFFSGMNRKTLRIWFCCLTGELYSRYTGSGIFLSGDVQLYASQGKRSRKLLTLSDFFFAF